MMHVLTAVPKRRARRRRLRGTAACIIRPGALVRIEHKRETGSAAALVLGLLRAWSVSSFATANGIERTLGLPVLATVRER